VAGNEQRVTSSEQRVTSDERRTGHRAAKSLRHNGRSSCRRARASHPHRYQKAVTSVSPFLGADRWPAAP
jgi:hypothetical protein